MTRLVDAHAAALVLPVKPATVRQWKHRGLVTAHGQDRRGRDLFDLAELQAISDLRHQERSQ